MGDTGKPADNAGETAKKTANPHEASTATTDNTSTPVESTSGGTGLTPAAQIAVDNQVAVLPGSIQPDKAAAEKLATQGNLEITPITAPDPTDNQEAEASQTEKVEPTTDAPKTAQVTIRTRSAELAELPSALSYQDSRSDLIDLTVKRVSQLPVDDKARQLVVRELTDQYDNSKTYAERLQAAKALLLLAKGPDGKDLDTVSKRDVYIAEKFHWVGRSPNTRKVVDAEAKHELRPVTRSEIQNFINNSAETLDKQVKDLKDKPADDKERHNLNQKLTLIFQTASDDTPEKLAAAKGLIELNRRSDGSIPEVLGSRTIEHPPVMRAATRGNQNPGIAKPAWTENAETKYATVEAYLDKRSEALLADTAKVVEQRERTATADAAVAKQNAPKAEATQRTDLYNRSVHIFLDSKVPEDKTAAAIALLELARNSDGSIAENIGARNVHVNAKTVSNGRNGSVRIIEPARDYIQPVAKNDALSYLQQQLDSSAPPRGRVMAADALKSAGAIDETRYKEVIRGVISDDRSPEELKVSLRKSANLTEVQETLKSTWDGRTEVRKPEDYIDIPKEQLAVLTDTLLKLANSEGTKDLVPAKQLEEMKAELKEGRFGPASRDFYNQSAELVNQLTTGMAVWITARNGTLPEGCPITVPKDASGRAIGDDYFRAQLLSSRLSMDLKTLKPGELPEGNRLTDAALWTAKATQEFDNMRLKWEVSVFDDDLKAFNKNGKLDKWMSNDTMSLDQMRELQNARGEWLQLGMQVRNYAHAIQYFNKATNDASNIPRISFSKAEMSVFSDEALDDKNFPGKVVRDKEKGGKIVSIEIDLPESLDRGDTKNIEKVTKLRAWLEKYGPKVDQVTDEIRQASIKTGRLLVWSDTEDSGIDEVTKKPYNFTANRFTSEVVKVRMPDGTEEERIKVSATKQRKYAGDLSLYKTVGDITDVGNPVTSGEVTVNGKVIPLDAGDAGITLGTNGTVKVTGDAVDSNHASMRVAADGRIFIKDNGSQSGTYVSGEKIDSSKWVEVFPDQVVTLGKPAPTLELGKNDKGEVTLNGQTLRVGEPTKIGSSTGVKIDGDGVAGEHSTVRADADGKVYIKDNGSGKGTYVNGKPVSDKEWTQISSSDTVTFGAPASTLDIQGDVRLYKPGDMVTVLLDGQMQLMPAENLKAWGNEAAAWHYTGKGAMALMDLGMIVTGTIELKGLQVAATQGIKEVGKVGARAVFNQMVHSPGFVRAAWHTGLGVTGLLHQSIENTGPGGKKFNEARGYAMMADIFYGSVVKDSVNLSRKAFGMAKQVEKGSAVADYLAVAPWAKAATKVTEKMFLGMNGYFVGEIGAHQVPALVSSIRGHDAASLLKSGMLLRDTEYNSGREKDAPPLPSLETEARRFATPAAGEKITKVTKEATEAAKLPKQEQQKYLAELSRQFLDSANSDDKLAAAFGLFAFHKAATNSVPDILGTRYKTQNDLPENVTETSVKAYIDSRIPRSISLFDKELQTAVESRFTTVSKVADLPADNAERIKVNEQLLRSVTGGKTENERVSAALGLMMLNERDGKAPERFSTTDSATGRKIEVKSADLRKLLDQYQSRALLSRFDSYVDALPAGESLNAVLGKTRELIAKPDNAVARKIESTRLQEVFEKSTNKEEKAAAALGLIFLNADKKTGAFPETLAQTTYAVTVNKFIAGGTGAYGVRGGVGVGGMGRWEKVQEQRVRDLKSADVIQYLKGNMPSFQPGTQLAMGDLLFRADEAPLAGRSKFNDYTGLLLSVVQNPNASPEARKQALVNPHGLGLAEAMEVHRFNTEPEMLKRENKEKLGPLQADIYGRDSKAIEETLLGIVEQPDADKDLRALASMTLLANSETDVATRKSMLTQMRLDYEATKSTPGGYYQLVFERQSATIKNLIHGGEPAPENVSRVLRAALIMSKNNNWEEFGVSKLQMAQAMQSAFTSQESILASHALEPMLKHYGSLDSPGKRLAEKRLLSLIDDPKGESNSAGYFLKLDVINRLDQINSVIGPEFAAKARERITEVFTPGSPANQLSDETIKTAVIRALAKTGSNDDATQDLLKRIAGTGGDASPMVRSAALDYLTELRPVGFNQFAAKLLESEKDPEILRKLGNIEKSTRRLDPDSAEYREEYRKSFNRMMDAGLNKYSLAGVPDYIRNTLLNSDYMLRKTVNDINEGEGNWKWVWEKNWDLAKPYFEKNRAAMSAKLDEVIGNASTPAGDMDRRTLAWIVMSNGQSFDDNRNPDGTSTREEVVKRAANGLLRASQSSDEKVRNEVAPLLTMAIATQDRMPYEARSVLVSALENLKPGTKGSPVSKEDAGIALLSGLKRQFERTPRDGNDPSYRASHELQIKLIDAYSKYAGPESIAVLEAMAEDQSKASIERDPAGLVSEVTYADKSVRTVDYTPANDIWRMSHATKDGVKQTLVRQGTSDEWYDETDPTKKTVWRGKLSMDQTSAALRMIEPSGKSTTFTADGATINKNADQVVTKVTYPDGSSREITANSELVIDSKGLKQRWQRQADSDTWTADSDPHKRGPRVGKAGFDAEGNFVVQGSPVTVIKPDASTLYYADGKPYFSTPSNSEYSAHPMPLLRERAKQILGDLRDGTETLIRGLKLDSQSSTQQLADNLRKVAENHDNNSEIIARTVLVTGLSKPLTGADDPRRAILRDLLNDPHERIRMAAARVLVSSGANDVQKDEQHESRRAVAKEDRLLAISTIADMSKNGSKQGFRDDANKLIAELKKQSATPGSIRLDDVKLLEAALQNTKDARRIDQSVKTHTVDEQEKFEKATGALIRNTQGGLDSLDQPEWWAQHGYSMLENGSFIKTHIEASDAVSLNFFEKVKAMTYDDSFVEAKYRTVAEGVDRQRNEQVSLLIARAKSNNETPESQDARKALAYFVLGNGYPLPLAVRSQTVADATDALVSIYKKGGPGAAFAEQIITDTLVANPGVNLNTRMAFADAVMERVNLDPSARGNADNTKAALLLANALQAEHWAMPVSGHGDYRYQQSVQFQRQILNKLNQLGESISMPVLEAMSQAHPNPELQRYAGAIYERLKEGNTDLMTRTIPDTTTPPETQAKMIGERLARTVASRSEDDLVRELFRLAHPKTFSPEKAGTDPRLPVLQSALSDPSDRVRLVAAQALARAGDAQGLVALSEMQTSPKPGIRHEAILDYAQNFPSDFRITKLTPSSEAFARKTLTDASSSERAQIAAARLLLSAYPGDAVATETLVKTYASARTDVKAEAEKSIGLMFSNKPIESADDKRRDVLSNQLSNAAPETRLAAALLLSNSSVAGDFDKAAAVLSQLAVSGDNTKVAAKSILNEIITTGSDSQKDLVLREWNDAWIANNSAPTDRPPVPTELDQVRRYFRAADTSERAQIFALSEGEKKALIMQFTNLTEEAIEQSLQPAPSAEVIAPRENFNQFEVFRNRSELFSPLLGLDRLADNSFNRRPLQTRWQQPSFDDRWSQRIPTLGNTGLRTLDGSKPQPYYRATTGGVPSYSSTRRPLLLGEGSTSLATDKANYIRVDAEQAPAFLNLDGSKTGQYTAKDNSMLARLSVANMLQEESGTGATIQIGRDGKLSVQPGGADTGTSMRSRFALPEIPGSKQIVLDGKSETPPEFSDFLEYIDKVRPDVMQRGTIRASELSVMFLHYLRQREAGLQTGYVITPPLFNGDPGIFNSDSNAIRWYTKNTNDRAKPWNEIQADRERTRAAKLDDQLRKVLASADNRDPAGLHWQPAGKANIRKPEILNNPPVEKLEVNRLGLSELLPAELLQQSRFNLPATKDDTTANDTVISTAWLKPELWKIPHVESLDSNELIVVRTPGNKARVTSYNLSPASQEILRRYRYALLQDQISNLNRSAGR